jgi:predicted ATP-dependent endonuclease of OLD family
MNPTFIDIHIHTSENPDDLNRNYDIDALYTNVQKVAKGADTLISLSDHNVINEDAYLKASKVFRNMLIGCELHIRNYAEKPPYHCHILFSTQAIDHETIATINASLQRLYPKKYIANTDNVPQIQDIIKEFEKYDFLLLPHGGQAHSTFDVSIPDGIVFDSSLERSIYYNTFDGFTGRSTTGLERTIEYFKRLGIHDFVNLITCTDNYDPRKYPNAKADNAEEFVPTWINALPTFEGLRLSLSESSRFLYQKETPPNWSEYIKAVTLSCPTIEIDVQFSQGLNVIIGGSSSGKTLLVDSLYSKITGNFDKNVYVNSPFPVREIEVTNPSGLTPHYIHQNYILQVIDTKKGDSRIDEIDIIRTLFPDDDNLKLSIQKSLHDFRECFKRLLNCVKEIESTQEALKRIPALSHLILLSKVRDNVFEKLEPTEQQIKLTYIPKVKYQTYIAVLDDIDVFLSGNPIIEHDSSLIAKLKIELDQAKEFSEFELLIRDIIQKKRNVQKDFLLQLNREGQQKKDSFDKLKQLFKSYKSALETFRECLKTIKTFDVKFKSNTIKSMGHTLFIENHFKINSEILKDILNQFLKKESMLGAIDTLQPDALFLSNFKLKPKISDYDELEAKVYGQFELLNQKTFKITTNDGRNFDDLSAGWKTSVILDLILGYEEDYAPIIIDQPEDNLATHYINIGLIKAIKEIKPKKQIILVSHNATIPMLGDAQTVIVCKNEANKIEIKSNRLEGCINDKKVVDYIAELTDGGKTSIKKRVKKYDLRKFRD